MGAFAGELIGTALLILLGDGVVANVLLKNTKGHGGGWIVITFGWAMAVFVGVLVAAAASGAHLNPAVSIGLVVLAIGLSLGGTTGYAINPARDLGPRIMHALLPIRDKRDSDWGYAWIPLFGPVLGAVLAAIAFRGVG